MRLDWTPWGVHGAFHLAQQKGWYRQAGLDVSLEDGNGSVTTVQIVGAGDSFDLGHAALASAMIARERACRSRRWPCSPDRATSGCWCRPTPASAARAAERQEGRLHRRFAGSAFIDAFLAAGKLKKSDLELINVDAASKASTYAVGRADAAFSTIPFFLPVVSQTGRRTRCASPTSA